jgi:hypothetical protein
VLVGASEAQQVVGGTQQAVVGPSETQKAVVVTSEAQQGAVGTQVAGVVASEAQQAVVVSSEAQQAVVGASEAQQVVSGTQRAIAPSEGCCGTMESYKQIHAKAGEALERELLADFPIFQLRMETVRSWPTAAELKQELDLVLEKYGCSTKTQGQHIKCSRADLPTSKVKSLEKSKAATEPGKRRTRKSNVCGCDWRVVYKRVKQLRATNQPAGIDPDHMIITLHPTSTPMGAVRDPTSYCLID